MPKLPPPEHSKFKPGQSGNPKGRPKRITTLLKEQGLSKDDIIAGINCLINLDKKKLSELINDPGQPVWLVNLATAIQKDIQKGRVVTIDMALDRLIGRPTQSSNISGEITVNKRLFDD